MSGSGFVPSAEGFRRGIAGDCRRSTPDRTPENDDPASNQPERFAVLVVLAIGRLLDAGFEVLPTFRTPHVTIAFQPDLTEWLSRLEHLGTDRDRTPTMNLSRNRR